ncbi:GNAT family N-acetyltransferase [Trueperella pyogenes]|uniref:GNAT family N-acetyltransferase n=1 Tax=Trueperella pyogenes TaxID=1661 RepID=UPI0018FF7EF6|nr:GNAT family protein [Trueperella pyogenes]
MELPITTQRLKLRAHSLEDASALRAFYSQPKVARFLLDEPWNQDTAKAKVEERISKTDLDGPSHALALVIESEGQVIGDVALWFTDAENRVAEIGWVLDPAYGGQGYATEAVAAVLSLAFDHYNCRRVVAQMDARNNASAKLAERLGMVKEAHHRQDWFSKGEWTDTLIYAMLTSDR